MNHRVRLLPQDVPAREAAAILVAMAEGHPEAPEGIELFEWYWVPYDHPDLTISEAVIDLRNPPKDLDQAIEIHDEYVRPSGLEHMQGTVEIIYGETGELFADLPYKIGWNRRVRRAVLWFGG